MSGTLSAIVLTAQNNPLFTLSTIALTSYLWLVRRSRWRRFEAVHAKFKAKFDAGELTPRDAQEIMHVSAFYDMPLLMRYSLALALFKTYGVPSISRLLASTKEFTCPMKVSKRYIDTQILICSWLVFPLPGKVTDGQASGLSDPRGTLALARTNWLHSKYKINNEDYLYTLSLFILEPARRANQYGWRTLSAMEQQSYFLFWVEIGKRMGISEIPETLEALSEWSHEYEERAMVPAETNHEVACATVEELLYAAPEALGIKNFLRGIICCLLEDRVRDSMLLPVPPQSLCAFINFVLATVKAVNKHLCLPRTLPQMLITQEIPQYMPGSLPRLHPIRFPSTPWYRPQRAGIASLLDRLLVSVRLYADLPGPQYHCDGYRFEELGPLRYEREGHEEVMKIAEKLHGCPISGPFSLSPDK